MAQTRPKKRFPWGKTFSGLLLLLFIGVCILVWMTWQTLHNNTVQISSSNTSQQQEASAVDVWDLEVNGKPANLSFTPDPNPDAADIVADNERRRQSATAADAARRAASDPLPGAVDLTPMTPLNPTNLETPVQATNQQERPLRPNNVPAQDRGHEGGQTIHPNPIDNLM